MECGIEEYIYERRPEVLKLNASAFEDNSDIFALATIKAKTKEADKQVKSSAVKTMTNIAEGYEKSLCSLKEGGFSPKPAKEPEKLSNFSEDFENQSLELNFKVAKVTAKANENKKPLVQNSKMDGLLDNRSQCKIQLEDELEYEEHEEEIDDDHDTKSNIITNRNEEEIAELQEQVREEKRKRKRAVEIAQTLKTRYTAFKDKVQQSEQEGSMEEEKEAVTTGFPKMINMHSGILVKKCAVENAYEKIEPSKFYINMCYATWGYKELSKRCVRIRQVKKKKRKSLAKENNIEPKKM